ncbi:MAG: phosphoenolpyruvate carboxykinase, partial [Oscillospiraceae bacterium]|nr:phosphoenolpyruvate carboxykinase [Oscillospiraceae bacterium]
MDLTDNPSLLGWVDEIAARTKPDQIVWIDGSNEQLEQLRAEGCSTGELFKLNETLHPGCYLHRTTPNDVARVEGRTFICCKEEKDAGPTNHWMAPDKMYEKLYSLYEGAMKGRTMYVIPYAMGVIGSPFTKYGIELTDSIYVVLSMAIMTRVGRLVLDALGQSKDYIKGVHSLAQLNE